jgi:hypothetical protein
MNGLPVRRRDPSFGNRPGGHKLWLRQVFTNCNDAEPDPSNRTDAFTGFRSL